MSRLHSSLPTKKKAPKNFLKYIFQLLCCVSVRTSLTSCLLLFFFLFSYELMHSCWSPVPKCRPSFQHLVGQLEALRLSLSPAPPQKEPLLYVNLEGDEGEPGRGGAAGIGAPGPEEEATPAAGAPSWSVPWQRGAEDEERDWLMVGSGAALAIGGDYRYIIGPCGSPEEEEEVGGGGGRRRGESMDTLQEEVRDEEDDVVINV